jgi:hypothetical protein
VVLLECDLITKKLGLLLHGLNGEHEKILNLKKKLEPEQFIEVLIVLFENKYQKMKKIYDTRLLITIMIIFKMFFY